MHDKIISSYVENGVFMFRKARSYDTFKVVAIFLGLFFIIIGIGACSGNLIAGIFIILLGLGLSVAGILVEAFLFSHQKRIDASFPLNYSVYLNGQPLPISAPEQIAATYGRIQPGEELDVFFSPPYADVVSWKFIKIKNQYLSFPTLQGKNDQLVTFFTMPQSNANTTIMDISCFLMGLMKYNIMASHQVAFP